ncbi:hypothetical protein MLD38_009672 [Melastoma candidum]|uniref:Uncharacterized protein n=1 Tax=Melastoma candidum TaxID=119954 RepID=A0ACB9RXQ4_9MYRT|nr:hypothetical protein MLD38_009672 [Melastoma candidum]
MPCWEWDSLGLITWRKFLLALGFVVSDRIGAVDSAWDSTTSASVNIQSLAGDSRACPYDGYLVTESDSKPLTESNKALQRLLGKYLCIAYTTGVDALGKYWNMHKLVLASKHNTLLKVPNSLGLQVLQTRA